MNRFAVTRNTIDTLFALALLIAAAAFLWEARAWELKAGLFPRVVGIPAVVLLAAYLIIKLTGLAKESRGTADVSFEYDLEPSVVRRRTLTFVAWIGAFVAAVWLFGFLWGGTAITLVYLRLSARESWPLSLAVSAATWITIWLLGGPLNIPFPKGLAFDLLGL